MRTIAIASQKGGVGKTTTTVNLAAALGERKRQVLVVDLDPQANTTGWLGAQSTGKGLYEVFTENRIINGIILNTGIAGISLAPSSPWMVGTEKILAGEVGAETILHRALGKLNPADFDYVLIDCPPSLGILTVNALAAAKEVLVPVEAHVLALSGLIQLMQTVNVVRERLNENVRLTGILACRVDARTRHALDVVEQLRKRFGDLVYKTVIRENIRLAEAPSFRQPITEYDTKSAGAADYRALARETIKQEGKT